MVVSNNSLLKGNVEYRIPDRRHLNNKSIAFLGKSIYLGWNPRKGICLECNPIKSQSYLITHMHHLFYVPCMPWACCIELCPSHHTLCHEKERGRLENLTSNGIE